MRTVKVFSVSPEFAFHVMVLALDSLCETTQHSSTVQYVLFAGRGVDHHCQCGESQLLSHSARRIPLCTGIQYNKILA